MKVRHILRETANQSRLLSSDKINAFNAFVHFGGNKFAHGAFALSAIKFATILGKNFTRAAGASVHGLFGGSSINIVTNTNDHESDLQQVRMIVKSKKE